MSKDIERRVSRLEGHIGTELEVIELASGERHEFPPGGPVKTAARDPEPTFAQSVKRCWPGSNTYLLG